MTSKVSKIQYYVILFFYYKVWLNHCQMNHEANLAVMISLMAIDYLTIKTI